jgi:hypothetical protein
VTNGGGGMPAFKDNLTQKQIRDVAAYVTQRVGRRADRAKREGGPKTALCVSLRRGYATLSSAGSSTSASWRRREGISIAATAPTATTAAPIQIAGSIPSTNDSPLA